MIDNIYTRARWILDLALGTEGVEHSMRVCATAWRSLKSETVDVVAILHDVVEDSAWTLDDLRRLGGFDGDVIDAVDLLTRRKPNTYASYIDRIAYSGNEVAIRVKLADLEDHLTYTGDGELSVGLRVRYEKAQEKLHRALESRTTSAGPMIAFGD